MFKILGADGKEYGPVANDQIKKWVSEGRANNETMAQRSGETDWKPLAQYPELAEIFGVAPPVAAPATTAVTPPVAAASEPIGDAHVRAQQLVNGPAIGLIVTAILGIAGALFGVIWSLYSPGFMPPMHGMSPEATRMFQIVAGPAAMIARIIGLVVGVFILIGAIKMQKLTSYGLSMAAAIIAMIPCFSPCCLLGLPIGVWALVVLNKPEVKSQFH